MSFLPLDAPEAMITAAIINSSFFTIEHAYLPFGFFLYFLLVLVFSGCNITHKDIPAMVTTDLLINIVANSIG